MTIVNVSVPSIAGSLGVSPSEGTWAISSYMLAAAVVQPLAGWIGRRFGEVRTFVTSIVLFIIFSALCGFATSMPMLVAGRLMQGVVSGPMMSVAQALLIRNYPVHLRGLAMGLWAMVVIIAPVFGPILGGTITDNLSWPWLFYINVPVGALAAVASLVLLRKRESKKVKVPIDVVGLLLLVDRRRQPAVHARQRQRKGLVQLAGDHRRGRRLAVVACSFFIPWELTDAHPVVDLHLFKRRNFRRRLAVGRDRPTLPSRASTSSTRCGCRRRWATPAPGRATRSRRSASWRCSSRRSSAATSTGSTCALPPTFAFCVFATQPYWVVDAERSGQLRAAGRCRACCRAWAWRCSSCPSTRSCMSGVSASELASAAGLSNFLRTIAGSISTAVCVWMWNSRTDFITA